MKNLILIRHAKSSWVFSLKDKDRPLSNRGVTDAQLIASIFSEHLPSAFGIFSSTAKRASETAFIFAKKISYPLEDVIFNDNFYTFSVDQLEKNIKSFSNIYENCILFGHNDAITNFVNKFGDVFIENVPTAGFVWLEFDTDNWAEITKGKTKKTIFPKNLK